MLASISLGLFVFTFTCCAGGAMRIMVPGEAALMEVAVLNSADADLDAATANLKRDGINERLSRFYTDFLLQLGP